MATPLEHPVAVLETSFWIAAHRAEVAVNTLDVFTIVVPRAVEAELVSRQANHPAREYPYSTLFRHLRDKLLDPPLPGPPPLRVLGPGEADAIAVGQYLEARLLINERKGLVVARGMDVATLTVPELIAALMLRDVISRRAALRKLDLIIPITSRDLLEDVRRVIETA